MALPYRQNVNTGHRYKNVQTPSLSPVYTFQELASVGISALLTETHRSGLGTEMSVYYQIFRSSSDLPASLSYEDFPDTESTGTTCLFRLQHLARLGAAPGWLRLCLAPQSMPPVLAVLLGRGQKASPKSQGHE